MVCWAGLLPGWYPMEPKLPGIKRPTRSQLRRHAPAPAQNFALPRSQTNAVTSGKGVPLGTNANPLAVLATAFPCIPTDGMLHDNCIEAVHMPNSRHSLCRGTPERLPVN